MWARPQQALELGPRLLRVHARDGHVLAYELHRGRLLRSVPGLYFKLRIVVDIDAELAVLDEGDEIRGLLVAYAYM